MNYKIGIIGAGKMGTDIFYYLNNFNYSLVWICKSDKEKLIKTFNKKVKRLYNNELINKDAFDFKMNTTIISNALQDLSHCDIIIEAISESRELKVQLFRELDTVANKDCIFASNSSSILPSKMYPCNERKDKFIGLHFFYPIRLKNIVEVIKTDSTCTKTIKEVKSFLSAIKRFYLILPEQGAFILNKLFLDFQAGAYQIYQENVLGIKEIDELIKKNIFPVGVFEFFDNVGIDVMLTSVRNYTEDMNNKEFYQPLINKFQQLVDEHKLGVKTGCGFYNYNKNKEERYEEKITKSINNKSYNNEVINKLKHLYLNSAFKIIEKGFCTEQELEHCVKEYMGIV